MDKLLILNAIQQHYGFKNDSDFAEYLGIPAQNLSKWKARKTYDAELICTKCTKINAEWLLTGNEPMLKEDNTGIKIINNDRKTKDVIHISQEIPLYDLEATAGLKELFDSGKPQRVLDTIKIPNLPKCDGAIIVTGDSMYPLLKSGDIILYKETNFENVFFGEMYLLSVQLNEWEEYITVKYVQKSDKGDSYVRLASQNINHQPKDVHISKISALALIKASIRINTMM